MNKSKYIELQIKFFIQLKIFFKQNKDLGEKNYFYYINEENYNSLKRIFNIFNNNEINFLVIYFDTNLTLDEKLSKLKIEKRKKIIISINN